MSGNDIYYRRKLPHYHPDGYPVFITFRLADSLPKNVLMDLMKKREREVQSGAIEEKVVIENKHFFIFDEWLDRCESGPNWLLNERIAQIVLDEIKSIDGIRYKLNACCIMPNHVHLLIESLINKPASHSGKSANYPITDTLRMLKGRTAHKSNIELGRNGNFWQHESYDHFIRDEGELHRTILYIINNPVKAGFVKNWKDWTFTYINPKLGDW